VPNGTPASNDYREGVTVKRSLFLCCLLAWAGLALAGPNEGGVPASGTGVGQSCTVPPNEDEIPALGRLGLGTTGNPACPSAGVDSPPPERGAEGAEGDDPGDDSGSVTVLPEWVCTGTDRWTFLVSGIPPSEIQTMTLWIGESQYAPVGHEATGDETSLWDFRYPKGLRTTTASLQVSATGRGEIASPLVVKETSTFPDPDSVTVQGSVSVKLVPRVIRWEVRHDGDLYLRWSRSIHDLEITEPHFRSLLLALGVHTVWRGSWISADGDSVAVLPNGRTLTVLPFDRSAYGLRFNPAHSAEAIGAILTTSSRVLSARSSHVRIESRAQEPGAGGVTNTP